MLHVQGSDHSDLVVELPSVRTVPPGGTLAAAHRHSAVGVRSVLVSRSRTRAMCMRNVYSRLA
jgi:hypothetical protein